MKLQLLEPFHGGHHTNYIEALLPSLRRELINGSASEVTITVTKKHYELLQAEGIAKPEEVNLKYSTTLPNTPPNPSLKERLALLKSFSNSVDLVKPDSMVCTSADYDVMFNALLKHNINFGKNSSIYSVGVFHYGYPKSQHLSYKEKFKQLVYENSWKFSTWNKLLLVNPVLYEELIKQNNNLVSRLNLLPDPVPPRIDITPYDARKELGIPTDGVYIGFVGMMDHRKAIPELLAAFVESKIYQNSRLLLAGVLAPSYKILIQERYNHLVESKRIILINRHLSNEEIKYGYAAIDLHTILQYRRANLSANLLKAASYGKPIIVDNFGYTGMMANRFKLGYTCDIRNIESICYALNLGIESLPNFKETPQTKRLIQFHHPDNYANTILSELSDSYSQKLHSIKWGWVCDNNSN